MQRPDAETAVIEPPGNRRQDVIAGKLDTSAPITTGQPPQADRLGETSPIIQCTESVSAERAILQIVARLIRKPAPNRRKT
jgi:hypothetical protein